ncbi:hypothetical protein [Polymorphum gilvum]|uniref:hypothetical protein n=1 Tax=Polymorphum gilvum TaxID=991904 RepID=UPI000313B9D2|nr:hypothetical protein [Polymorphum gilvum]
MPHVLGFALLAAGGLLIARALRREMARVETALSKAARGAPGGEPVRLELDPETGRYRPEQP